MSASIEKKEQKSFSKSIVNIWCGDNQPVHFIHIRYPQKSHWIVINRLDFDDDMYSYKKHALIIGLARQSPWSIHLIWRAHFCICAHNFVNLKTIRMRTMWIVSGDYHRLTDVINRFRIYSELAKEKRATPFYLISPLFWSYFDWDM